MEKLIRVYDVSAPETELTTLSGHEKNIKIAMYYNDENTLLSAGDDKTVRYYIYIYRHRYVFFMCLWPFGTCLLSMQFIFVQHM